jgi:hypothetical protein
MVTHFDDKGKIFTDVVQKIPVGVTLQMPEQQIHGMLHVRTEKRIIEEMNGHEEFLALTQVEIFTVDGQKLLFSTHFLALNKSYICWIMADVDQKQE